MWLIVGGRIIFRSLSLKYSREELVLEHDEWNRHINLKASQRALQITQILCFIGGMARYGLGGDDYKHLMLSQDFSLRFSYPVWRILPRSSITATIPDGPQLPPSFRRLMMVPLSSAPIMSTTELMFSQIKRAITVPMEP